MILYLKLETGDLQNLKYGVFRVKEERRGEGGGYVCVTNEPAIHASRKATKKTAREQHPETIQRNVHKQLCPNTCYLTC